MVAYYNEIDPFAAEWLRNLIKAGHIADGVVDERSIVDVEPADLADYTQCHFFAGVGVWSLALRNAGWSDDRPVWTGSCPCQPFSSAGKGFGFNDERHLWPAFGWLIRKCRPATIVGEQVASKDADSWVDLVQTDMEALGYTFGAVPFPAASIGAPHIRDRTYWMGHTHKPGLQGRSAVRQRTDQCASWASSVADRLGNSNIDRCKSRGTASEKSRHRDSLDPTGSDDRTGPTNGFWRNADWLQCRDGKWRPVEPGTFPLANGIASRVGRLRAYGNAINAEQARIFIEAVMECIPQC
jgi:DNA (cytosine-5)-methyltransferase 1